MECSCWPEDAGVGFVPFLTLFPWQAHAECPLEEAENQVLAFQMFRQEGDGSNRRKAVLALWKGKGSGGQTVRAAE